MRAGVGLAIVDPFTARTAEMTGVVACRIAPAIPYEMAILYPVTRSRSRLAVALASHVRDAADHMLVE